ncbi:helix-turn-helix domain-containing protein [Stagnihabitans tardus]|uniref:Helix-turn-helix domain-containing protein n=1 Tax=Stagnihabitans tardus TaxID=2699202 RepID=A0AAE5BUF7_9RHOB|nr:helix-turn-helix transcriptional regulator [Stagnihabitans tardus]NBZ86058.1 helix-turn-helix domain-containing protein [Stagnihabitans tardus]
MHINPDKLRHLMAKTELRRAADLAARSKVSEKTIDRILDAEDHNSQTTTVTRLARALGVTPEDLAQPPAPGDLRQQQDPNAYSYRHAFTLTGSERLNLDLVGHRYGVSPADILKAAPALYALVAEMSLAKRRADLDLARQTRPVVAPHLQGAADMATGRLGEVLCAEEASIARADIFGRHLDKVFADRFDIEPPALDPFHDFIRTAAKAANPHAFSDLLGRGNLPERLFEDDLIAISGGDIAAAWALEHGRVRIQDIPAELRSNDRKADRIAFLASCLTEKDREWLDCIANMTQDALAEDEQKEPDHGL